MDITVKSFVQHALAPCFGPSKPKEEDRQATRAWETKKNVFTYNATAVIADSALVAAVASVAMAVFGAITPFFALALLVGAGLAYCDAKQELVHNNRIHSFVNRNGDGLKESDLRNWENTSLNICDLAAWFNLLPSPQKKPDAPKANNATAAHSTSSSSSSSSSTSSAADNETVDLTREMIGLSMLAANPQMSAESVAARMERYGFPVGENRSK